MLSGHDLMVNCAKTEFVAVKRSSELMNTISPNQNGFHEGRSTADRWIISPTEKYDYECNIMVIDLTKAVDCVDRSNNYYLKSYNTFLMRTICVLFSTSSQRLHRK